MAENTPPKAILFDIGGVCAKSPFQEIIDFERIHHIPNGWVNFSISRAAPNGAWHRLERGEVALDGAFYAHFSSDLSNRTVWSQFVARHAQRHPEAPPLSPTPPPIDAEALFWRIMTGAAAPDPAIAPALPKLRESRRFVLGALTNNVVLPPGKVRAMRIADDLRKLFDVWVSSAIVGFRKPDLRIYELALARLRESAVERGMMEAGGMLKAEDVLFLDDIGENLKAARRVGMRTLKVELGRSREAVVELERITGLRLLVDEERAKL